MSFGESRYLAAPKCQITRRGTEPLCAHRLIDWFVVYYVIDAQVTEATMPLQSYTSISTVIIRLPFAIVSSEI